MASTAMYARSDYVVLARFEIAATVFDFSGVISLKIHYVRGLGRFDEFGVCNREF